MLARLSAVAQDFFVVATGILKGIGKDGHAVKGFFFIDAFSKSKDGGSEPRGVDCDGVEGIKK